MSGSGRGGGGAYPVPARVHRVEQVVRRSRFIATLARASRPETAHIFIQAVQEEFSDARHHCWAFLAGPPGDTAQVGLSDAGEPHGTAGRPILNALLHSGVGEVVAVVTRYFGGVKLGTGGLSRAYAGAVGLALESLPREVKTFRVPVRIEVGFSHMDALVRTLDQLGAVAREEAFGTGVEVRARVPEASLAELRHLVAGFTAGAGKVEVIGEGG